MISIEPPFAAVNSSWSRCSRGLAEDTTEENIQARLRGVILMALSNKFGSLLLTTGNKSELAVGYCTLYGDMCGGLAVISDVPKTMVYRLAEWINREREIIPAASITKPPSAELRPTRPTRTPCRPTKFWTRSSNIRRAGPFAGGDHRTGILRGGCPAGGAPDRSQRIQAPPGAERAPTK